MEKRINNSVKTIATTSTEVSEYGINRDVIILTNTSLAGEVITIAVGKQAIAGQGIVLTQGASFSLSKDAGYTPPIDQINAVASVATATLSIYEEVRA